MPRIRAYRKEINVRAACEDFKSVKAFIEPFFQQEKMNDISIAECTLLLEEIFLKAVEQIDDEQASITVVVRRRVNDLFVDYSYDGPRFTCKNEPIELYDLGAKIISRYEEKMGIRFRRGRNRISVLATRSYDRMMWLNLISTLSAFILGSVLYYSVDANVIKYIHGIVLNIQNLFNTALLMISAPVTFFSFVTNITNIVILADRRVNIKSLIRGIALSSIFALVLGVGYEYLLHFSNLFSSETRMVIKDVSKEMVSEVATVIPTDIFSAFTSNSPFPLIVLAIITASAIASMNSHFVEAKALNDSIGRIFNSGLKVIYYFLPMFIFLSVLEIILWNGHTAVVMFAGMLAVCFVGMLLMFMVNMLRLKARGIKAVEFTRKCMPAFKENFKINSPIEAIPYNIRFCNKHLGIKNRYAESAIPILSHLNLDGNCFLIMFCCFFIAKTTGINEGATLLLGLSIVVLGLSLGAPNQPGSLLIGLTMALSLIGEASGMISVIILLEAYAGRLLTLINTFGNLTTIRIEAGAAGEMKQVLPEK